MIMKNGKPFRRICIAEAAWCHWAEKGGKWNGGKNGKKSKKGEVDEHVEGDVEGIGLKACNAYSYDENGDREFSYQEFFGFCTWSD